LHVKVFVYPEKKNLQSNSSCLVSLIMRRFFLDRQGIHSDSPTLTGSDVKHISTVLRSKPGDEIFLFDGQGYDYHARIVNITHKAITLSILTRYPSTSEPCVHIAIGQALIKARKMDRIVRQLTELGGSAFLPFIAQRSVVRPDGERFSKKRTRWETIAIEALKQCGRSQTPHIGPIASFEGLVSTSQTYDLCVIFHDHKREAAPECFPHTKQRITRVLALIGPEGGFTAEEVTLALEAGFTHGYLGPRTLKSDTAAVTATAVIQHLLGDLRRPQKDLDNAKLF